MADQDKDKVVAKPKVSYEELFAQPTKGAGVSYDALFPKQTPEEKLAEEQYQKKSFIGKFATGVEKGALSLWSGIQATLGEVLPVLASPFQSDYGDLISPEDAYVASQVIKQKAVDNLKKSGEIYGHGVWNDVGTMVPLITGIAASAAAAPLTEGTSLSVIPTILGEGTLITLTASTYGNSITEQEMYEKDTGKVIPEFSKQSVAILSAASMLLAGEIMGAGTKGVSKALGEAFSSALKESPELAESMMRRYIAETPGAATKLMNLGKVTAIESAKGAGSFGLMTFAQDLLNNINKYPEDRLAFREIVTDALNSAKAGALFGALLGPIQVGESSMYNYLRRKKQGITVVQTADGQVFEKVGESPIDPNKVTVMDGKLNFKDIRREDIEDSFSMTLAEKEKYLDAFKNHQEAMPGIEDAIKRNAVKRQTKELSYQLIFKGQKGGKSGLGASGGMENNIVMYGAPDGSKYFVESISPDGSLASLLKVVPRGDGTYEIKRAMDKDFDKSKTVTIPVDDFAQMAFENYTMGEAAQPKPNVDKKTGQVISPEERQANEESAHKATKVGDEIKYMGRNWEVQDIDIDGTIKVNELKENGEYGESLDIPASKISEINAKFEEPKVEMVSVDGKKVAAHQSEPLYEKDGAPVSKAYIRGAIRLAKSPMDLTGLRWDNDPELDKMYKTKFPDMVQTYTIGKDEVERDEVIGAINHASDVKDLTEIKVNLDPEVQGILDAKFTALGGKPEEKTNEKPVKKPVVQDIVPENKVVSKDGKINAKDIVENLKPIETEKPKKKGKEPNTPEGMAQELGITYEGQVDVDGKPQEQYKFKLSDTFGKFKGQELKISIEPGNSINALRAKVYDATEPYREELVNPEGKLPHEMTSTEYKNWSEGTKKGGHFETYTAPWAPRDESGKAIGPWWFGHKGAVTRAIKEGKTIPPEVLKEYPGIEEEVRKYYPETQKQSIEVTDKKQVEKEISRIKAIPDYPEKQKDIDFYQHKLDLINADVKSEDDVNHPLIEDVVSGKVPVYHGTFGEFEQFDPTKLGTSTGAPSAKEGFFFATNPLVAKSYASKARKRIDLIHLEIKEIDGAIEKLTGDSHIQAAHKLIQLTVNKTPAYSEEINQKVQDLLERSAYLEDELQGFEETWMNDQIELADNGKLKEVTLNIKNPLIKDYQGKGQRDESFYDVIKKAKEAGNDGVVFRNVFDGGDPAGNDHMTDIYVVFNQDQINNKPEGNVEGKTEKQGPSTDITEGAGKGNNLSGGAAPVQGGTIEEGKGILKGIHKIVHDRFKANIESDYERYKKQYLDKFGNEISGDNAKELSPDYRANKTEFSQAVHNPASDFAKKLYDDLIKGEPAGEANNYVLMTAGGTGAGKTTIKNFHVEKEGPPYLVYDSNMSNFDSSKDRIEKALENGKEVDILFVWRDPFDAYVHGVITRMKEESRSIGINVHIETTQKSLANIKDIYDLYKDNENVDFEFFDNSIKEYVNPEDIFSKIPIDEEDLRRRIYNEVQSLFDKRGITQEEKSALLEEASRGDQVTDDSTRQGETGTEVGQPTFTAEESISKPDLPGKSLQYTPLDAWQDNLFKARDYARHLFSTEELDAMTANGSLKWNDTASIVGIIKGKIAQLEPKATVETGITEQMLPKHRIGLFVEKATPIKMQGLTPEQQEIEKYKLAMPHMKIGKAGMTAHNSILKAIPIMPNLKPGDWFRNGEMGEVIMPFSVEVRHLGEYYRVFPDPNAYVLMMAHYYEQNGDLMSDPYIEVGIYPAYGIAIPIAYEQHNMGIYQELVNSEGKIKEKQILDVMQFINQWMRNIKAQGRTITEKDRQNGTQEQSIETIENKATTISNEAEDVADREQAGKILEEVDSQIEEIDSQLQLLGDYEIPEEYYNSHEYPQRGLEPLIKKDVAKFSKEIAGLLGWEHDTIKKGKKEITEYANVNIAPAGGDVHFILWKPGTDLGVYVTIPYSPTQEPSETEKWKLQGMQGYGPIMWRLTTKAKKYTGMNNQWIQADVTAGDLAKKIKSLADAYEKSENKRNFDNLNVTYEKPEAPIGDQAVPNTISIGTSELPSGVEPAETGGPLPSGETTGISKSAGGESRQVGDYLAQRGQKQGPSGGVGNIQHTGTTPGGGATTVVEGTQESATGDTSKPKDLSEQNFVLNDETFSLPHTETAKIRANIAAIELVSKLEKEGRNATPAEKDILAKYTGWGGLATVLDKQKWDSPHYYPEWHKKYGSYYKKLAELLTPEEFTNAVNSTINAHYTAIPIIKELWKLAEHLGFRGGNVLEPAAGVGHFFGVMPNYLQNRSSLKAYELDSITGRILAKLYPRAKVNIKGYELANEGIASQDLIITNVPFGKTAPFDERNQDLSKFSLHNYFIAKGIRQLKPGGIGVFITSSSTMDNAASAKFRDWVVSEGNADFIGAIRLPNNAFAENAGTEVTTDILVFRKRLGDIISPNAKDFRITKIIDKTETKYGEPINIEVNQYYADNPDNMLGKMMLAHEAGSGGLYTGDSQTLAPVRGQDTITELADRISKMPKGIMETTESKPALETLAADVEDKNGTLISRGGKIYEVKDGDLILTDWNDKTIKVKGKSYKTNKITEDYLQVKNITNDLITLEQMPDVDIKVLDDLRKKLNTVYDNFQKSYGTINRNKVLEFLEDDSEHNAVAALEDVTSTSELDKAGRNVKRWYVDKSPIFDERVNFPVVEPTSADNVEDALYISMSYRNNVDIPYIASLLGMTEEQATNELLEEGLVYRNPATEQIEDKDTYLSGYVRTKYKTALEISRDNPTYLKNVEALKAVVPNDIPGQLIKFSLGSPWMPPDIVQQFIKKHLDITSVVAFNNATGHWVIRAKDGQYGAKNKTAGTEHFNGFELIDKALNLRTPRVVKTEYTWVYGKRQKTERVDVEATAQAQGKMDEIMDEFVNYVYDDKDHVDKIETVYNDKYNDYIEKTHTAPTFDYFPGASRSIKLMEHQKIGAIRGLKASTLFAMQVGTGKTFTMATTAMELKRLKLAKKPMIVVQNATLEQFASEFRKLYPASKLLVPTKNQMDAKKRQMLFNKIAYGDWDSIIIPQSFLDFIPDDPARVRAYIQERIAELQEVLDEVDDGSYNNPVASDIKKTIEALELEVHNLDNPKEKKTKKVKDVAKSNLAKAKTLTAQASRRKDDVRLFEKMGVDALFVDEAHAYKKLGFATALQNIKGIDTKGSKRAFSLNMKLKFIQEKMKGRNVFLSTGTPITNTMAEVWTMMKYVSPDILKKHNIDTFDKFAATFGSIEPSLEFTAAGKFKIVKRFKSYKNAPELMNLFRANSYVVLTEDIPEFKESNTIPRLKNGEHTKIVIPQTETLKEQMARFKSILERWEKLPPKEKRDNRHVPLVVFTRAKMAAIDLRLLNPANYDDPDSKTNHVVKEVKRIYDATNSYKGAQLVFSDIYQSPYMGTGTDRFDLYEDIKNKLISQGIPADEIVVLREQAGAQREGIFERVNNGTIRILMGSTQKLGTGVNVQSLLAAIHHIDAPDRPDKFEQRNGRILRQGNEHADMELPVEIVTYGVEKTLDATAYQRLAIKQKFINQMMKGEKLDRETTDAAADEEATDLTFDQMMATLSGSLSAVLHTQKMYELKKLQTAKRNYERGLIDAKKGLQNAKTLVGYLTDALTDVKNAIELIKKYFKPLEIKKEGEEGRISGLNVKSITFNGRQYHGEKLIESFNTELTKEIDLFKNNAGAAPRTSIMKINDIPVPVFISYDARNDRFMYQVEPIQGSSAEAKITGYFTSGVGFFQSFKITMNNFLNDKMKDVEARLLRHQTDIPNYEKALEKTFDKQDKLDKTEMEVKELEEKMKVETEKDLSVPKPIHPAIFQKAGELAMDKTIPEQMRKDADEFYASKSENPYTQHKEYNDLLKKYPELQQAFDKAIELNALYTLNNKKINFLRAQLKLAEENGQLRTVEMLNEYLARIDKAETPEIANILSEMADRSYAIRNKFEEINLASQNTGEFDDLDAEFDDSVEPEPVFMRRAKLDESELRDQIAKLEGNIDELYRLKASRIETIKSATPEGLFAGEKIGRKETNANVNRIIEDYNNQIAGIEAELIGLRKQLDTAVKENEGQRSIWDNPDYPRYKFIPGEFAGDQVAAMREHELERRARIMAEYTGVPIIVVRTKGDLPKGILKHAISQFGDLRESSIPAVYDRANKKVYVVAEDTKSVSDMVSNLSHEIFAHHGLVALLGKEPYLDVLQLTYRGMSPVDIVHYAEERSVPLSDWKTIAEEYIGDMAGNGEINPTLWQRIIAKIREWIRKIFSIAMSKAEIINLLRKSKENLVKNKPEPRDYSNMGEYLDALTAYTTGTEKVRGKFGYGIHVYESKVISESVSKGNLDYRTYFEIAKSQIGSRVAEWIEKGLVRNNFDIDETLNYLQSKAIQYERYTRHFNMIKDAKTYLETNPPKNPDALYKVLIGKGKSPDELNFLTWDKPVDYAQIEDVLNQLDVESKFDLTIHGAFHSGESLYNKVVQLYGSDREASLFLSRAGIDGMIHIDKEATVLGDRESNKKYIIYDNTPVDVLNQIAFKRAQKPSFVGEHLENAGKVYADKAKTKRNWDETVQGIREYIQDLNLPVRKFEEEILRRGGLQPNDAKPYRNISLSFGRQETLYKQYIKAKMKPVIESIAKIIRGGMPGENILPYLISKHAIERNMVMRADELDEFINKPSPNDPTQQQIDEFKDVIADKDYSGVMAFDVNKEFVNPDELAGAIVDEFEASVPNSLISELWNNMRPASAQILDYWEQGQQLSPEQKQEYLNKYQFFLPLRGWREGAAKDLVYVKGEGFKKSLMHAEGRKSLADNPLAYMQSVAFSAIGELMDYEVKSSMLRLVMRNLSNADLYDLVTIKKLYYVKVNLPDGSYEWEPTLDRPSQDMFDNGDAVTKIYNEHQKLRAPKQAREHEVVVRKQGGDVVMIFKGKMLSVAQAMNKRNFMYHNIFGKVKDARVMNQAVTGLSYMNNFLKAAYTSWNIVFPFTNFMRDFQEASITQAIKGDSGHIVIANYRRAFPSIIRFLRDKLDMNNPDDVKLRDFYLTGGATGFTHLLAAEDLEKDLNAEINRIAGRGTVRGDIKHYAHEAVNIISIWNQVFEDATRFSVYLTSLELGKSKEDAASDAKEASVNFNRKGKSSKLYDSIYAFWNVAWQSLQKNFKLGKDHPRRFAAIASAFMALGFIEALLNNTTDDEDPENDYYNINPYMRENYLILPNLPKIISGESKGNKYLSIPLPQFWRGFKSIGSIAYDLTQGKVTPGEAVVKALMNFGSAMSPIDIGGFGKTGEFSLAPIMPTVAKPFYEIATNRNYMGYTIAKEPFDKGQEKLLANARLGKDNVNPAAKFFTDMLFRWGGGDNTTKYYISKTGEEKQVPGFLDINPSFIEHLFKGITGGSGAVLSDIITTISQALSPDEEVNFKNIPFVNKFIRQTPEAKWNIIAEYYNLKDAVSAHKGLKRDYQKQAEAGGSTAGIEATEGSNYYQAYQDILDSYDKDIKEISDQVDFNDIEGTKPVYDLMSQCIADIKALKKQFNMK
jgi:N12 class adenine-specific DNA methylase